MVGVQFCLMRFYKKKLHTMTLKGGNTDELYKDDGRLKMAQSLVDQHHICTVSWKFGVINTMLITMVLKKINLDLNKI